MICCEKDNNTTRRDLTDVCMVHERYPGTRGKIASKITSTIALSVSLALPEDSWINQWSSEFNEGVSPVHHGTLFLVRKDSSTRGRPKPYLQGGRAPSRTWCTSSVKVLLSEITLITFIVIWTASKGYPKHFNRTTQKNHIIGFDRSSALNFS